MAPRSAAGWNADQMPRLREPGIARARRWCRQRVPGHARNRVRVECDVGLRHLTTVECRLPWRQSAGSESTRFPISPAPLHPEPPGTGCCTGATVTCASHLYDQLGPSPGIGDLLREIDRDLIAIFWGWAVQAEAFTQCRYLTALDPGAVEAAVMRGPPGCGTPRCGSIGLRPALTGHGRRFPAGVGPQGRHHLAGCAFRFAGWRHDAGKPVSGAKRTPRFAADLLKGKRDSLGG